MPYTQKQLRFFRIAMHDMHRPKSERDRFRKMYNEGKNMQKKKPVKKRRANGRKSK